jgi:hypothetical protein
MYLELISEYKFQELKLMFVPFEAIGFHFFQLSQEDCVVFPISELTRTTIVATFSSPPGISTCSLCMRNKAKLIS